MPHIGAQQRQRFGAIRHGELSDGFGFSPRNYMADAWLRPSQFNKRQDGPSNEECADGADWHTCLDIGRADGCCKNSQYCFISNGATPEVSCCSTGNDCTERNDCPALQYACIQTITITVQVSSSGSSRQIGIPSPTITTTMSCCERACQTDAFLCPQSLGGGCCSLGQSCMLGAQCGTYIAPPTTVATIQDANCSAGEFSCQDEEKGCCKNGDECTVSLNKGYCARASATQRADRNPGNFTEVATDPPGTLSGGEKAGISVGVTLAALLILAITFCFIRRRRRATIAARSDTASTVLQPGVPMTDAHTSPGVGGVGGAGGAGGVGGRTGWRRGRGEGGAMDYFGPRATAGPYTENVETAGVGEGEVSPGQWGRGAVPVSPDGPGDIVPAVEIGGGERRPTLDRETEGSNLATQRMQESVALEEVGVGEGGIEPAPAYEESTVELAPGRRGRNNTIQGGAKDVPETPDYRHELP